MKTAAIAFLFAVLTIPLHAQTPAKQGRLLVSTGDVTDNRTTGPFNAECKIELKFTGDAADGATVREVKVTKALDELGRNIVPEEKNDSFGHSGFGHHSHGTLQGEVVLRNPSRNASVIKLVEGEVELFNPTPENGGILVIKDILKHPAEAVDNPTLKKYGVQLIYLTKESYEAKKKEIDAQEKKEAGAIGGAFSEMFKGMFGGMMGSDSQNSVKLYIQDPNKRVVDFEFQDANGNALKTHGSWSSGGMHNIDLAAPAPADAQLLVHLATPEATQSFPFKLENIPLP